MGRKKKTATDTGMEAAPTPDNTPGHLATIQPEQAHVPSDLAGLLRLKASGDPLTPLTESEKYAVSLVLASKLTPEDALARANLSITPQEFFGSAHVQLFAKQCLAQWEMQMRLSISTIMQNLMDMAEVDVAAASLKKLEDFTPAERNALLGVDITETTDPETGEVTRRVKYKFGKLEANKEFVRIFGLRPDHPYVRSMGAIGGGQEAKTDKPKVVWKIAGKDVEF